MVLRVFRPDLVLEQAKRFIEIFLDNKTFSSAQSTSFADMMKVTEPEVATLLIKGAATVDG
jgi:hypothetical protein